MTATSVNLVGQVDSEDRFIGGDEAFTALNARAGGEIGAPLATPQLATVARLARRLAIPVARPITIADVDSDLDCWVRARPTTEGVTITLVEVSERAPAPRPVRPVPAAAPPPGADWTWETDASLRLRRIDEEGAARHALDPAALLGQPLTRAFTLAPTDGGSMPLLEAFADRQDFDGQPATLPNGRAVRLAGAAIGDGALGLLGYVGGVFEDAPGIEPAPAQADGFNQRLEAALRAPLSRIVAEADAMNAEVDGPLAPHYVEYAADIASAGRHLLALVDDLADLNAIERPDFKVEADDIDLADVARRAGGLLSVRAADSGVTIVRPAPEVSVAASGEFRRTLQILVNLVGNAVRYSPRGATVTIEAERQGDRALVCVADRGKGIAPEDQARIFAKFERVDPTEPGGSGLGLYIARRLARVMGGELSVESAPGEGARFTLELPAR